MSTPFGIKMAFGLYGALWSLAVPGLFFNKRMREGYRQRCGLCDIEPVTIWVQAASVGESFLVWQLARQLQPREPVKILLTSNTRQGVEILTNIKNDQQLSPLLAISVGYFPFDKPRIIKKFMTKARPKLLVLLESELWPGLLMVAKEQGIKVLVVNGRMTAKSLAGYLRWPDFWRFVGPDYILAMSTDNLHRFQQLFPAANSQKMANIKFDRLDDGSNLAGLVNPLVSLLPKTNSPFVVLASVRQPEEEILLAIISSLIADNSQIVIGLFPRHMHRLEAWQELLTAKGIFWVLRSEIVGEVPGGTVIVWDIMGELARSFELAQATYVGGSIVNLGGQNFLEPLSVGLRPVIGCHWQNFSWVGREIINQGLVYEVQDSEQLLAALLAQVKKVDDRQEVRQLAFGYVKKRRGGTEQACRLINELISE